MGLENYNIVDIEDALIAKLKTLGLTSNLYPSGRPAVVVNTGMTEFLVIRASTDIDDRNAYGTIMTVVEIYVKDAGNLPSRARISSIRNTIATVLPYIEHSLLHQSHRGFIQLVRHKQQHMVMRMKAIFLAVGNFKG